MAWACVTVRVPLEHNPFAVRLSHEPGRRSQQWRGGHGCCFATNGIVGRSQFQGVFGAVGQSSDGVLQGARLAGRVNKGESDRIPAPEFASSQFLAVLVFRDLIVLRIVPFKLDLPGAGCGYEARRSRDNRRDGGLVRGSGLAAFVDRPNPKGVGQAFSEIGHREPGGVLPEVGAIRDISPPSEGATSGFLLVLIAGDGGVVRVVPRQGHFADSCCGDQIGWRVRRRLLRRGLLVPRCGATTVGVHGPDPEGVLRVIREAGHGVRCRSGTTSWDVVPFWDFEHVCSAGITVVSGCPDDHAAPSHR